jgi:hypothetical protein
LIGHFIGCDALQVQCCRVISALLNTLKDNPSKDIANVLGEQLQVPHILRPRIIFNQSIPNVLCSFFVGCVVFSLEVGSMLHSL